MTKAQFIKEAKRLGFNKPQELVEKLGYHPRTLSRYKADAQISKKIEKELIEFKGGANQAQEVAPKPNKKSTKKEVEKEVKKETAQDDAIEAEIEVVEDAQKQIEAQKAQEIEAQKAQEIEAPKVETPKAQKNEIGIDISNEEYHSSNKIGVSKLKVLIDNAKEFESRYIKKEVEQKETDALIVGKLHHTLVLEPHKFDDEYIIINLPARPVKDDLVEALEALGGEVDLKENGKGDIVVADTVDGLKKKIEAIKESTHKTICTKAQYELAQQTSQKALNSWFELIVAGKTLLKAQLKDLLQLEKCYVEKTFYGTIDGVDVQVRPDILINLGLKNDIWFVIDLKTLEVATPNMFVKQGGAFFWHLQEQFYLEVLRQNGIIPKAFYFNCAGKKEFSGAGFYEWGINTKEEGKKIMKAGVSKYKYCTENNIFLESKFDYVNLKFEAITTLDVPIYVSHQLGDLGV